MFRVDRSVHRKNAIDMINFVLQQLGEASICPQAVPLPMFILVADFN